MLSPAANGENEDVPPSFVRAARWCAAGLVIAFGSLYLVWRPFVPGGPAMSDFAAYYAAGATWTHHADPYSAGVWIAERALPGALQFREGMNPYVGPPLGLPLWAAFAHLPYTAAIVIWGAFLAACIAVVLIVPARLARRTLGTGDAVSLVLFACACAPLICGLALGQAALPAAAGVALAIWFAARLQLGWCAVAAAAAAVFKPNLALPLVMLVRTGPIALALGIAALLTAGVNVLVAGGPHAALAYLRLLPQHAAAERFYSYQFTPAAIAHGFGAAPGVAERVGVTVTVLAVIVVGAVIWRRRAGVVDGALLCCAAVPFVVPYVHEVDFAIVIVPALVAFFRARGAAWALAACALMLLSVNPFALAHGRSGIAFSLAGAAVAALSLAALARAPRLTLRFAPFAVVLLVVALGVAAPKQILPTWPADLPRDFNPGARAPANVVWHREIVATGLEDVSPWVALLRTLTLGGALLAGAAYAFSLHPGAEAAFRVRGRRVVVLPVADPSTP